MLVHPQFDPVALSLGPLQIHWYGLTYLAAFGLFLFLAARRVRLPHFAAAGWARRDVEDMLFLGVLGVIVGGRIGYALFYKPAEYLADPLQILMVWKGGMSFHGGFAGCVLAVVLFGLKNRVPILSLGDVTCAVGPIGLLLGRIANFINGELWGRAADPNSVPWAMVFPTGGPLPRHPSQLYEAALEGVVLFLVMQFMARGARDPAAAGRLGGTFLLGYGLCRAFVELFREPDAHLGLLFGFITMGQLLSLPMIVLGLALIIWSWRRGGRQALP